MSKSVEDFLSSYLPIVGLAAYSVELPNAVLVSECLSKSLYPASTAQMLTHVVQDGRTLLSSGEQAAQYCWTFEGHRVYVASRTDGVCLVLLVENNPSAQVDRVQEVLQGFIDLPEVEADRGLTASPPCLELRDDLCSGPARSKSSF
jgi:hypothetical protein